MTTRSLWLEVGTIFVVLDGRPYGLLLEPGRLPTTRERAGVRDPHDSGARKREREQQRAEPDDDLLDDQEAIRQAMIEQRRQPPDLLNAAA